MLPRQLWQLVSSAKQGSMVLHLVKAMQIHVNHVFQASMLWQRVQIIVRSAPRAVLALIMVPLHIHLALPVDTTVFLVKQGALLAPVLQGVQLKNGGDSGSKFS